MSKNKSYQKSSLAAVQPKVHTAVSPAVAWALAMAFLIKILYLVFSQKSPFYEPLLLDPEYYHHWAQRILGGDWVGDGVFYGLPLYPFFLALCYKLFAGSLMAVKVIQALLGLGTLFFIYKIGEKIASPPVGLIAIFLAAVYGPLFFHEGILIPEALGLPLYAASFYTALVFSDRPTIKNGIIFGFLSALAALTKAGIIPFVFIFSGAMLFRGVTTAKKKAAQVFSILAAFLLTLAPVTAHNIIYGKDTVLLTSHSGYNFYIGNNPKAEGVFVAPEGMGANVDAQISDAKTVVEKEMGRDLKPSEVSRYWSNKAWDFIRHNPVDCLKLYMRKMMLFFDAREISDVDDYSFCGNFNPFLKLPWLNFAILGPLCLGGFIVLFQSIRYRFLVYSWVLSYLGGILLFFVNARYRLPLLSIFFPVAALAILDIYESFKKAAWFKVILWVVVLILGVAVTQAKLVGINQAQDYVNAGDAESKKNDYDDALALYKKALQIDPRDVKANQAMGVLFSRLGKEDEAKAFYETAIALDPNNYQSHNNLGLWYDHEGNLDEAKSHFLKAIELKPNSSQAHNNLGMIYGKEGDNERAMKEFDISLRLDPHNARTHTNLGLILYRLGKSEDARKSWETALHIDPGFEAAKRALELLKNKLLKNK